MRVTPIDVLADLFDIDRGRAEEIIRAIEKEVKAWIAFELLKKKVLPVPQTSPA
ncbi:hypothetical protein [Pyrococcus kukulkanii]|uniref:hypothetical protein n=1 Tax=Pyrococcus kukulkanii TaxID=1609559 RepID=UPI00356619DC